MCGVAEACCTSVVCIILTTLDNIRHSAVFIERTCRSCLCSIYNIGAFIIQACALIPLCLTAMCANLAKSFVCSYMYTSPCPTGCGDFACILLLVLSGYLYLQFVQPHYDKSPMLYVAGDYYNASLVRRAGE